MASSSKSQFVSSLSKKDDEKGDETSWGESLTQSMASLRQLGKRAVSKKVQFKNEVVAIRVDRDFWKFKCETEPLCENKRQSKSLENLKATYNDKLVNVRRSKRALVKS